jgi:hypothetical protein
MASPLNIGLSPLKTMVAAATISGCHSFRSVADYVADLPPMRWPGWAPGATR